MRAAHCCREARRRCQHIEAAAARCCAAAGAVAATGAGAVAATSAGATISAIAGGGGCRWGPGWRGWNANRDRQRLRCIVQIEGHRVSPDSAGQPLPACVFHLQVWLGEHGIAF